MSLRNLNLLLLVDPRTEKVKWRQTGPWMKQHDPDFQSSGKISLFNNNHDGTVDRSDRRGSQIVEVDPATRETTIRYGGKPGQTW